MMNKAKTQQIDKEQICETNITIIISRIHKDSLQIDEQEIVFIKMSKVYH
jgi:hypothetical protein